MSQGREMFALEWVKGEIFGALEDARQALEAFAEFGRDETRMRICLTSLHQVHGTLVMLELPGVALLADHLERLAQGLLNKQFPDDGLPSEALMQGILELPVRLEQIQAGGADTESGVLPLVNRIRKQLHLDEVAPPRPVQFVADEAALDRFERINGRAKIKRIRAAYQGVLLALLKGEDEPHFLDTLKKVGVGLERICKDTPSEILWQSFGEFVDSLRLATRPLSAEVIKVLRRLDAEIRRFAQDGVEAILEPVPERLLLQLIDAAQVRGQPTSRLLEMRRRMEPVNDGELLASGREALVAASRVLTEEIAGVKDHLDLLVRGDQPDADKLVILADSLRRIASTCGVLGFESSRLIVLDQLEVLERFKDLTELDREQLFGIASALVQVEENLASVTHLTGQAQRAPGVSEAERQVLIESRTGLEAIKQAIVNFVGSGFANEHLNGVARSLQGISAALRITGFVRPASLLEDCHAFLVTEISALSSDGQPAQWERLDRFADCLSGIDYHLERLVTNVGAKADDILDVVERSLVATGYLGRGLVLAAMESATAYLDQAEPEVDSEAASSAEREIAQAQTVADNVSLSAQPVEESQGENDADGGNASDDAGGVLQELVDSGMPVIDLDSLTIESATQISTDEFATESAWEMAPADAAVADELELAASEMEEQNSSGVILGMESPFEETLEVDTGTLSTDQSLATASSFGFVVPAEIDISEISLDNLSVESKPNLLVSAINDEASTSLVEAVELPLPVETLVEVSILAPDIADESSSLPLGSTMMESVEGLAVQLFEATLPEPEPVDDVKIVAADASRMEAMSDGGAVEFDLTDSRFDILESYTPSTESLVAQGDAELRGVFSEEAEEVVLILDEMLSRWQQDPADEAAVREIRRGFHTLKGSGRMVGAQQIGELAWAIENMLNRVLDGTLHSVGEIQVAARSARELMPALLLAFNKNIPAAGDKTAQLIELADVLASGGTLASEDDAAESLKTSPEEEELSLFLAEAREYLALLRSKTGRRRVQLDDELLMALHSFVGGANLMAPGMLARCAELLYEVARAAQAQALRGPNVEVDMARLFQQAAEFIGASLDRLEAGIEVDDVAAAEVIALATSLSLVADETPAEEMLLGLVQLEAVLGARASFDAWKIGPPTPGFVDQFIASMRAIQGATFRPQIIDIAKALIQAISQLETTSRLPEPTHIVLLESCERLLQVVDAIGTDQFLPRVDDVVTKLGDLAGINAASPAGPESSDKASSDKASSDKASAATLPIASEIETPSAVEIMPVQRTDTGVSISSTELAQVDREAEQLDVELAEVFFEEAEELLEALDASVQAFVLDGRNGLPLENMLRGLHTLKGSARLTGLGVVGDRVHKLESFLSGLQFGRDEITTPIQQRVQGSFDAISTLTIRVREQYRHKSDTVGDGRKSVVQASEAEAAAGSQDLIQRSEAKPTPLSSHPGSALNSVTAGPDMIRVRANLLETLVNLAGESSILRARVEQGINDFAVALDEMGVTIERQREQLRRLELETDVQVAVFRAERADRRQEYFDPLEMDRYSQLQQLSRALSESASDMLDLKDTLLFKSREAETILLQQARINTELQEGLMRTRMVPFSRLLPRLRRIVRQVAQELKKDVEIHVLNAEGELDRNLLERMVPPLEHMLRNAVDHGIESTMVRRSFGKSIPGRIDLRLSREGGDIVIEITDDGAGIDIETVRAKAMERGMLRPDANLSDDEVLDFVLAPGFSTAKSLTQISGRGVGLDVVNNEVKALGGSIGIYSSPGKGTRFVLRVPFTVSVNRALMVTVGDDQYAIPLNTIEGIVLVDSSELQAIYSSDDKLFEYAGLAYRVRYLGRYLGRDLPNVTGRGGVPLVLVRSGDQSMAVAVDGVQGSREIVVKSLGQQFAGVGGISGATILGDGSVVVILDLLALIRAQGREALGSVIRDVANHVHTRCVMVVDDSVTVRKVTTRLLERQGMDVIVAKDGVEAMSLLGERTPDIMLLDIEMPRMDGFEVARQMRHDPRIARIPIIMISSRTGAKHKDHALSLGINRFLGKPFQESELLAAIDELGLRR